ncbi:hypothetical protein [Salinibacterium sp. ZJ454]|uniref:hypothetical protein n=1 Tax=Salinibacterium sp. ZJ454 TaxID=2708339 RepID=UPI00141EADF3|nr:hypothetical protein [Salinibacterium sp. ZJ454]
MDASALNVFASDVIQVGGLPLHPLIVHATVVITPLTVLALLLGQFWPAARRRLGVVTPLAALVVLVLVPITVLAGQSLKQVVGPIPAVLHHEALGLMLLPWVIALFVVAVAQWVWFRYGVPRMQLSSTGTLGAARADEAARTARTARAQDATRTARGADTARTARADDTARTARGARLTPTARLITVALAVASVVVGVGTVVMIALIGDSGARAVWGTLLG